MATKLFPWTAVAPPCVLSHAFKLIPGVLSEWLPRLKAIGQCRAWSHVGQSHALPGVRGKGCWSQAGLWSKLACASRIKPGKVGRPHLFPLRCGEGGCVWLRQFSTGLSNNLFWFCFKSGVYIYKFWRILNTALFASSSLVMGRIFFLKDVV